MVAGIFILGELLYISWRYARRVCLLKADLPADIICAIERRIIIAQALYGFGALLGFVDTYWSLGFILLVQMNYVLAPRLGVLSRL